MHTAVGDVGVIGVPDELRGQIAKAFVVLKPGRTATSAELIEHCKDKIAKYKLPREVVFVNELPRTAVGKLLRRGFREEKTQGGTVAPPPGAGWRKKERANITFSRLCIEGIGEEEHSV